MMMIFDYNYFERTNTGLVYVTSDIFNHDTRVAKVMKISSKFGTLNAPATYISTANSGNPNVIVSSPNR